MITEEELAEIARGIITLPDRREYFHGWTDARILIPKLWHEVMRLRAEAQEMEKELHRLAEELGAPDEGPQENVDFALRKIKELSTRPNVRALIMETLGLYCCQSTLDWDGNPLPLVDALTPRGSDSIEPGQHELFLIADRLAFELFGPGQEKSDESGN